MQDRATSPRGIDKYGYQAHHYLPAHHSKVWATTVTYKVSTAATIHSRSGKHSLAGL